MDNASFQISIFFMDILTECPDGEHSFVCFAKDQGMVRFGFRKHGQQVVGLDDGFTLDDFMRIAYERLYATEKLMVSLYTMRSGGDVSQSYEVRCWGVTEHQYSVIPLSSLKHRSMVIGGSNFVFYDSWSH